MLMILGDVFSLERPAKPAQIPADVQQDTAGKNPLHGMWVYTLYQQCTPDSKRCSECKDLCNKTYLPANSSYCFMSHVYTLSNEVFAFNFKNLIWIILLLLFIWCFFYEVQRNAKYMLKLYPFEGIRILFVVSYGQHFHSIRNPDDIRHRLGSVLYV